MKEFIHAKHIYEKIIKLSEEISKLEEKVLLVTTKSLDKSVKVKLTNPHTSNTSANNTSGMASIEVDKIWVNGECFKKVSKDNLDLKLLDSEFIVMFGALIKYKQDFRSSLINQFNELNLKLKI